LVYNNDFSYISRMLFYGGAYMRTLTVHTKINRFQNTPSDERSSIYLLLKPRSNQLCPTSRCHGNEGRSGKNLVSITRWPIPENLLL